MLAIICCVGKRHGGCSLFEIIITIVFCLEGGSVYARNFKASFKQTNKRILNIFFTEFFIKMIDVVITSSCIRVGDNQWNFRVCFLGLIKACKDV